MVNNKNMEKLSKQQWLLEKYVSYFFIYSFIGWVFEVIVTLFESQELVNRGFLTLPILPVYGFGALLISLIFKDDDHQWFYVAIVGGLLATLLELITSYALEYIFDVSMWDYSGLQYNFDGRISLLTSVFFMIGSVLIVKVLNPVFERKLRRFKYNPKLEYFLGILCLITFIDFIYSTIILIK